MSEVVILRRRRGGRLQVVLGKFQKLRPVDPFDGMTTGAGDGDEYGCLIVGRDLEFVLHDIEVVVLGLIGEAWSKADKKCEKGGNPEAVRQAKQGASV